MVSLRALRHSISPFLASLYAAVLLVPWNPTSFGDGLDPSWNLVLHVAFLLNLQFGTDVVFTFGPLGFVYEGTYHPGTYPLVLGFWLYIALVFGFVCWNLLLGMTRRVYITVPLFIVLLAILAQSTDSLLTSLPLVLLVRYFHAERRLIGQNGLLLAALAVASLVKFTFLLAAVAVVAAITADELLRRRLPRYLPTLAGLLLALWVACGQSLAGFLAYVRNSWLLTGGYTEAMSLPSSSVTPALFFSMASVVVLGLAADSAVRNRNPGHGLSVLGVVAILFLLFKAGFVRHDAHELIATLALPFVLTVAALAFAPVMTSPLRRRFLFYSALLAAWVSWTSLSTFTHLSLPQTIVRTIALEVPEGFAAIMQLRDQEAIRQARFDSTLHEIRSRNPVPAVAGSVDLFPYNQAVVVAHGLRYNPRPVIQSYSAYTPKLAEMNARHLRSDRPPDHILFDVASIDGRLPSMDDGISWLELLKHYQPVDNSGRFLILSRMPRARQVDLIPLATLELGFGTMLSLPDMPDEAIWASVEFAPTLLGALTRLLYKPPLLLASITTAAGERRLYRLIPGMTSSGFLLSPVVDSRDAFARLAADAGFAELNSKQVRAVTFHSTATRPHLFFAPKIRVSLWRLKISPSAVRA